MRTLLMLALVLALPARAEDRVARARRARGEAVVRMFRDAGLAYPPGEVFIRIHKAEREVELWAGPRAAPLVRVKTWPVCASSGTLGPKRREGDLQVPEGFYFVNHFNPWSDFHLSLGLSYPNASDRVLSDRRRPGGAIYIHGSCVTIGCVPIEDEGVEELYLAALEARGAGQKSIPVHVFPHRMDEAGMTFLAAQAGGDAALRAFWENLRPGWERFETTHRPPAVDVDARTGRYRVRK